MDANVLKGTRAGGDAACALTRW